MVQLFGNRLLIILFLSVFLLTLLSESGSASSTVLNIRYSVQSDHTRIVLDLTTQTSYQIVKFKKPNRIAINLKRVKVSDRIRPPRIANGVVQRVRVNRLSWGSQIVLDLREKADWKHFALAKAKGRPNRIVVDVYPVSRPAQTSLRVPVVIGGSTAKGRPAAREYIVVIDPGHGGMDPGTRGKYGLIEKHLVLDISKRVAKEINNHKGIKAVLTRTRDVFIEPSSRPKIAQRKGADIFMSIHANSAPNRRARGTEVWFLSPAGASVEASKLMSNKKQAASELGLQAKPSDEILSLVLDVNQKAMMQRSSLLAEEILNAMRRKGFPPSRGMKQKALAVVKKMIPSVLIETGFIGNSSDAKFLKSEKGRDMMAKAIATGVVSYLKRYPPPSSGKSEVIVHKVKKGETLWRISKLYGSSVGSIQKANGLGRSTVLRVGQELLILSR
ncbi:MAG: LysM peptidoglycan-binding domain-containing protein [Candidatus Latescibacteria bacterium]|nr:LysM peptidoglycan-binding domain-containing protein [Candidatus Latescibacterota bacterium]NIM64575.1 LysM peptidoglycan-binding domain-containing protein [Candidatus Latescibacterota bacterium]NIO01090.1 LysM peptidoglycan-binding domain-containing protein [Candidatus Latescibacterota bacterium]NIO27483.1 LysM peptidoglycan-binding domain-containing protein [Candidatus Latescibacterota bacterium]NIO55005.1 LysM peptidoglycan-binding domain-containing protein [Candidatus Latescibacterota ba